MLLPEVLPVNNVRSAKLDKKELKEVEGIWRKGGKGKKKSRGMQWKRKRIKKKRKNRWRRKRIKEKNDGEGKERSEG